MEKRFTATKTMNDWMNEWMDCMELNAEKTAHSFYEMEIFTQFLFSFHCKSEFSPFTKEKWKKNENQNQRKLISRYSEQQRIRLDCNFIECGLHQPALEPFKHWTHRKSIEKKCKFTSFARKNTHFFCKFPRWWTEIIVAFFPLYCKFVHVRSFHQ